MAVAVYDSAGQTYDTNTSFILYSQDVGSGSNRFLVIPVTPDSGDAGDRVINYADYNGDLATHASADADSGSYERTEMWWLANPDSGSNNVYVEAIGVIDNLAGYAVAFTGAHQSALDAAHGNFESSAESPAAEPITVVTDGSFVVSIISTIDDATNGVGGSQTDMGAFATGFLRASYSGSHSAGAVSHSYTVDSATTFCISMVSIKPAAAANTRRYTLPVLGVG